jgi:hypothetical protein
MTLATAAILTATEEICLGTIGTTETVAAGTVALGAYQPLDDDRIASLARVLPRVEVEWMGDRDTGMLPRMGGHASLEIKVQVRLIYAFDFELQDAERRTVRAAAALTGNKIRNALTRNGNLITTNAGTATELSSGAYKKADLKVRREDLKRRLWIAEIDCTGLVCTSRG